MSLNMDARLTAISDVDCKQTIVIIIIIKIIYGFVPIHSFNQTLATLYKKKISVNE